MWSSGCEELVETVEAFLRRICRASEPGVEVVSIFSSDVAPTSAATQQLSSRQTVFLFPSVCSFVVVVICGSTEIRVSTSIPVPAPLPVEGLGLRK